MEDAKPRYKGREIKATLAMIRQKPVPPRTWAYWKARLHIRADEDGFYDKEHFDQLKGLVKALKKGWTIDNYIDWLIIQYERKNSEIESGRTESTTQQQSANREPIEVPAVAC